MTDPDICCHGDCHQGRECPLVGEYHEPEAIDAVFTFLLGLACGLGVAAIIATVILRLP